MSVNGSLSKVFNQASCTLERLRALVEQKAGGWDAAIAVADARRAELDLHTGSESDGSTKGGNTLAAPKSKLPTSGASTPGSDAPLSPSEGTTESYIDASAAALLRQRLVRASEHATSTASVNSTTPATYSRTLDLPRPAPITQVNSTDSVDSSKPKAPGVHPLADHPDEAVSALARDLSELESELVSFGPEYVRWPANIGWKNFSVYMLIPTLVYELEYPRTDR